MRHYQTFRLPLGLRPLLLKALARFPGQYRAEWRQVTLREMSERSEVELNHGAIRESLLHAIRSTTGLALKKDVFSVVLHESHQGIPAHTDGMARSCFLVPLVCTPTQFFHEDRERRPLAGLRLLRFNDHLPHGVDNPFRGRMVLLTLAMEGH